MAQIQEVSLVLFFITNVLATEPKTNYRDGRGT